MYPYSYLEIFYTGLAFVIFAGWWFVWSLHIIAILHGKYRLHKPVRRPSPNSNLLGLSTPGETGYLRSSSSQTKYIITQSSNHNNYQTINCSAFSNTTIPPDILPSIQLASTNSALSQEVPEQFVNPNFQDDIITTASLARDQTDVLQNVSCDKQTINNLNQTIVSTGSFLVPMDCTDDEDWKQIFVPSSIDGGTHKPHESPRKYSLNSSCNTSNSKIRPTPIFPSGCDTRCNGSSNTTTPCSFKIGTGSGRMILSAQHSHSPTNTILASSSASSSYTRCHNLHAIDHDTVKIPYSSCLYSTSPNSKGSFVSKQHGRSLSMGCSSNQNSNICCESFIHNKESSNTAQLDDNRCPGQALSESPPPIPQKNHNIRHILDSAYGKQPTLQHNLNKNYNNSSLSSQQQHYRSLSGGNPYHLNNSSNNFFNNGIVSNNNRIINFAPRPTPDTTSYCSVTQKLDRLDGSLTEIIPATATIDQKNDDFTCSINMSTCSDQIVSSKSFHMSSSSPSNMDDLSYTISNTHNDDYLKNIPGVTIIKPLLGVDSNLAFNLETFFRLDYPKFEICFCVQDYQDPCISLVKRLLAKYPYVDATLFLGSPDIVVNAKINNMAPAYNAAKYELILISDAGIMMTPQALSDMVHTMTTKIGLVHQMPFVTDRNGFSSILEKVYFGTSHARIYLASDVLGVNCCTGMSSMFRKAIIQQLPGGLTWFGKYLAEDYFIAEAVRKAGYKHRISTGPALQNAAPAESATFGIRSFHERLIRWSKLRFTMVPVTMVFEPLSECLVLGLMNSWAVFYLFEWNSLVFFAVHCLVWFLLDYTLLRIVQNGKLPFTRTQFLLAWFYREISALPLFLVALNTSSQVIRWKNRTYKLRWGGYVEKMRDSSYHKSYEDLETSIKGKDFDEEDVNCSNEFDFNPDQKIGKNGSKNTKLFLSRFGIKLPKFKGVSKAIFRFMPNLSFLNVPSYLCRLFRSSNSYKNNNNKNKANPLPTPALNNGRNVIITANSHTLEAA